MALPDVGTLVDQANRGRGLDRALRQSKTTPGRLTWVWDSTGDLVWDRSGSYSVLSAVCAKKGQHRPDRNFGTLLHRVTKDRRATGTQLGAYTRDGGAQVEKAGWASNVKGVPTKLATARWRLRLSWSAAGEAQVKVLEL